jgi:Protein of unknown function (DUF3052)
MGRESECTCECSRSTFQVKALLEPPELILRGGLRRRLPFSRLTGIRADGAILRFDFEGEAFALTLGGDLPVKWARVLTTPPPTLAKKLGISEDTTVRIVGAVDDEAFGSALATAKAVGDDGAELILARVNTARELADALRVSAKQLAARVPIWFIYPKGKGHALSENDIRSTALAAGIVDTKVAAVSPTLTALRFVRRRDT